jgi:hypothetical protein
MIVECIQCALGICDNCDSEKIYWSDDGPFCSEEHARIFKENGRINAQDEQREAEEALKESEVWNGENRSP